MSRSADQEKVHNALTGTPQTAEQVAEKCGLGLKTTNRHLTLLFLSDESEVFKGPGTKAAPTYYRRDRKHLSPGEVSRDTHLPNGKKFTVSSLRSGSVFESETAEEQEPGLVYVPLEEAP